MNLSQFSAREQESLRLIEEASHVARRSSFSLSLLSILIGSSLSLISFLWFSEYPHLSGGLNGAISLTVGVAGGVVSVLLLWRLLPLMVMRVSPAWLLRALLEPIARCSALFLRIERWGIPNISRSEFYDEDVLKQIIALIEKGAEISQLSGSQAEILRKAARFSERTAAALMTPRHSLVWVKEGAEIASVLPTLLESRHHFFPVGRGSLDEIIGMVSSGILAHALNSGSTRVLPSIVEPVLVVAGSMSLAAVLEQFRREHRSLAIVLDEYGGVDGIITTHDLMEALVGELSDQSSAASEVISDPCGVIVVDAGIDLEEIEMLLQRPLRMGNSGRAGYHSLGGFVMERLGRVPEEGTSFCENSTLFTVLSMQGNRICKVKIEPLEQTVLPDDQARTVEDEPIQG